jgi:transcriptional regulator with XRE-family HTH domain
MAKMGYSITNRRGVSIGLAKKKFAIEKKTSGRKSQIAQFLKARIGKGKKTASKVASEGDIHGGYISELMNNKKDGLSMTADAIARLADGLDESPVTVFKAAIGDLDTATLDDDLVTVLKNFSRLDNDAKAELRFMIDQLKKMTRERLHRRS